VRLGAALAVAALLFTPAALQSESSARLLRLPVHRGDDPAAPLGTLLGSAPSVVSFWATYCPPCRAEVPILQRAARRWGSRGVRIVGIAVDLRDAAGVARAAREWGIDYETYWIAGDAGGDVARLAPAGLPVTFFVGPDGAARYDRLLTDTDLDALVPRHLGVAGSP
jgi:thiol-disulfide isomerase/thioredoxin